MTQATNEPRTLDTLTSATFGRFLIETASGSHYLIENTPDRPATLTRTTGYIPDPEFPSATLRRDGEACTILDFPPITVGAPAFFVLSPLSANGAFATNRITTPVLSIVEVPDGLDSIAPEI